MYHTQRFFQIKEAAVRKTVIGVIGEAGAGKETFARVLIARITHLGVFHTTFSNTLVETLKAWNIAPTRPNCQLLAQVMNKGFGDGTLTRAALHQVQARDERIIIVDGVRWQADFDGLKALAKDHTEVIMVYVTADPKIRFERLTVRNQRPGETGLTWEQFVRESEAPNEQLIGTLGNMADFEIENNGTLKDLERRVVAFLDTYMWR